MGQAATRLRKMARVRAAVQESPLAKRVTSCPRRTSLFGEVGNNSFRSAIETRRAAFSEGGNLGNFHRRSRFGVRRQTGWQVDLSEPKSRRLVPRNRVGAGIAARMEFPSWPGARAGSVLGPERRTSTGGERRQALVCGDPGRPRRRTAADEIIHFYEETASAGNQSPVRLVTGRLTNCHVEERYTQILGPPGDNVVHLCVDMQRMFAEATEWKMPWLERVLPNITAITTAHPERTLFTRFIPAREPGHGVGMWRRYYGRWASMTIDRIGPDMIGLCTRSYEVRSSGEDLRQACVFSLDRERSACAAA